MGLLGRVEHVLTSQSISADTRSDGVDLRHADYIVFAVTVTEAATLSVALRIEVSVDNSTWSELVGALNSYATVTANGFYLMVPNKQQTASSGTARSQHPYIRVLLDLATGSATVTIDAFIQDMY